MNFMSNVLIQSTQAGIYFSTQMIWERTYSKILEDRLLDKMLFSYLSSEERQLLFQITLGHELHDGFGNTIMSI